MSIEKKCSECDIIIVDEWFFGCSGYLCNKTLSYNCAVSNASKLLKKFPNDVKKGMKIVMDEVPGLRWFCPDCINGMNDYLLNMDNSLKRIEKLEDTLKTTIQALSSSPVLEERRVTRAMTRAVDQEKSLNEKKLAASHSPATSLETLTPSVLPKMPTVRTATATASTATSPPSPISPATQSSAPAVSQLLMVDTESMNKPIPIEVVTSNLHTTSNHDSQIAITIVKPRRLIFASRFHKSTTVETLENYLKEKFKLTSAYCIKLIPKPRNGLPCDHSSFRISVADEDFERVSNLMSWPNGVFIKEFEFKKNPIFRKPPNLINLK